MDVALFGFFILAFASLVILPGPNVAFAIGQSLKYGVLGSIWVSIGFMAATGVHAVLVFSGLGLFLKNYQVALNIFKWFGVIYLLCLAYKAYTKKLEIILLTTKSISKLKMFLSALFVSLTNPKAILASIMIYPIFISPNYSYAFQATIYSLTAMAISFMNYGSYTLIASKLKGGISNFLLGNKVVGAVYIAAAGFLAMK